MKSVVIHLSLGLLLLITRADFKIIPEQEQDPFFKDGMAQLKERMGIKPNDNPARNVILFIGDGMGVSTLTASRIREGQLRGETGEENMLSFEKFPWVSLSKTYSSDSQVSDSACTATAILAGVKTNYATLGVSDQVKLDNCTTHTSKDNLTPITRLAQDAGMSTGIVTTMKLTHATPAATYAHTASRNWECDSDMKDVKNCSTPDIAKQFLSIPGDGFRVVLSGGRGKLTPKELQDPEDKSKFGERSDGRNLIDEWTEKYKNSKYVWNLTEFNEVDPEKTDYLLGLFQPGHMHYEVDRADDIAGEPSLVEMTEKAIKILQKNTKGFFLMVEGGKIDYGHHINVAYRALDETIMLSNAVKKAQELVDLDETLIIVTADHSHTFTIGGYAVRGNPILGIDERGTADIDTEGNKVFTTLGYANGPGGLNGIRAVPNDTETKNYKQQATVKSRTSGHGGEDVGTFSQGPQAHLLGGLVEQSYIFHVMDSALCLSKSKQGSCAKHKVRGGDVQLAASVISTVLSFALALILM